MYDAIEASNLPVGAGLYAGYVNGNWPSYNAIKARFPNATVVGISVSAQADVGDILDCEPGNCTPQECPGWVQMRRASGVDPTVYCNQNDPNTGWPAVRAAFRAQGVSEPHYWVANYDGDPTIPVGAIGKQYANPGPYDTSSVAEYWPGVDPVPNPQGVDMSALDNTDPNWGALIWRVNALVDNLSNVADGPTKGEVNKVAAAFASIESEITALRSQISQPPVDVSALALALAQNTVLLEAIASAVTSRLGSELK